MIAKRSSFSPSVREDGFCSRGRLRSLHLQAAPESRLLRDNLIASTKVDGNQKRFFAVSRLQFSF
jgi:hypothetical protein